MLKTNDKIKYVRNYNRFAHNLLAYSKNRGEVIAIVVKVEDDIAHLDNGDRIPSNWVEPIK